MAFWGNLLGYQAAWFATVWSAGRGEGWIGMLACAAFIVWQWWVSPNRAGDERALIAAIFCGIVIDGVLAGSAWLRYASSQPGLPAPLWILLLWAAFAMTMNHSMAWFATHRAWAVLFAAFGGPLAYLGAARAFQSVVFPAPAWPALVVLVTGWAIAFPLLLRIAHGSTRQRPPSEVHA